jgi:hypothetical protein
MSAKSFIAAAAAALCLAAGTGAALADTATASSPVNVRYTPGGAKVGVLYRGEEVEVLKCTGGWCLISHPGPDGWVSEDYLEFTDFGDDGFEDEVVIDLGDDGFEDDEEEEVAEVCFYDKANFGGDTFCIEGEETNKRLSGYWNDRISSIEISGGLTVDLCTDKNLYGACATFSSSRSSLPAALNNKVTSYEIY